MRHPGRHLPFWPKKYRECSSRSLQTSKLIFQAGNDEKRRQGHALDKLGTELWKLISELLC
jgi:hypothetical protein